MEGPEPRDTHPPTREQVEAALEAARRMRELGIDVHHLGHLVLYLNERNQGLERFLRDADRYFRFGQDDGERRNLLRQLERLAAGPGWHSQFPV